MRRAIRVKRVDGSSEDLEISKVAAIHDKDGSMSVLIHLDKLKDGTWRLTYNTTHIPDFSQIVALEVIRERWADER